jgi:hypothetical protein
MSEVSLKSAFGAYREYRSSDSIEALCESVVEGQAKYGYTITHLYSFIDDSNAVQLFYCRDGNHEDLHTSPYVRKLTLLWESGHLRSTPGYLKRAYADFLHAEAAEKAALEARRAEYVRWNTGRFIRRCLESLGSDLLQPHLITFNLVVKYDEEKSITSALERRGFKRAGGAGSPGTGYSLFFEKELTVNNAVDENAISDLADEVNDMAEAAGGKLSHCSVEPVMAKPVKGKGSRPRRVSMKSKDSRPRKAWWKFW